MDDVLQDAQTLAKDSRSSAGPWTAALEMRDLIAEAPAAVSACQPSQRSLLLDERRVAVDDLPLGNLIRAVVGFEQAQSPTDLTRVAMALGKWRKCRHWAAHSRRQR